MKDRGERKNERKQKSKKERKGIINKKAKKK